MKILVIGSGGREHAIVWALRKTSTAALKIYCAPGNAGIAQIAEVVPLDVSDTLGLISFAKTEEIDLIFVGPEAPLVAGIVDRFESAGLPVVGPTAVAARLEGSKVFAKDFMTRLNIPTAFYRTAATPQEALRYLASGEFGSAETAVVVKADGLAAGKGVFIASSHAEARKAIEALMVGNVAGTQAAKQIVLEEALDGPEASLLVFADGRDYALMPPARDHKRIGENDTGPNTGGMGTITAPFVLSSTQCDQAVREIVEPTLIGAAREGFPFKGVLFLGLMLTKGGPKLLEYNVRFGDPETQAILVRLNSDLLAILDSIRKCTLGQIRIDWTEGASACVIAANEGYPGKYRSGSVINGLESNGLGGVEVFHSGTSKSADGEFLATGGRVLGVTAARSTLPEALTECYAALETIHWPGMQYRRDIGRVSSISGTTD